MAIVAPLSKFKKNNIKIYIVFCLAFGAWCAYDGYLNKKWIAQHKDAEGNPELYLSVNRRAPFVLAGAAVLLGIYGYAIRNRKIVAEENDLVFSDRLRIPYGSIEKIDKTNFEKKGYFLLTYRKDDGTEADKKVDDRDYDNLPPLLDHLVSHLTGEPPKGGERNAAGPGRPA